MLILPISQEPRLTKEGRPFSAISINNMLKMNVDKVTN
jgi:hypothetical protein